MPEVGGEFPYRNIVAELRAQILDGALAPGERMSSEWELAERFVTSRPTVRRALAVLKSEGLVITEQGRGTFVRPQPPARLVVTAANFRRHRAAGLAGFNAQMLEQGRNPSQRLIEVAEEDAPTEIAALLGVDTGYRVLVRRRMFVVDDRAVARCDSFYPADLVRNTPIGEPLLIPGGAVRVIEDPDGPIRRRLARSVDDLTCRMPTAQEFDVLGLTPGVPVVRVLRTMFDGDGCPVEVQDTVAAADRHSFHYEVDL